MVEVEIGSGRGQYLIERALHNPGIHFVGIERRPIFVRLARERAKRQKLANVEFIQADARAAVHELDPASVSVFHVYFPDPWFKRKHLRRRLVTCDFLALLHGKLQPVGLLEIATDAADYFEKIRREIAAAGVKWNQIRESVNQRFLDGPAKTLFESKYEAQRKNLYYLELRR